MVSQALIEARKRKEERDAEEAAALEALELAAYELEEKQIALGKKRGVDFDVHITLLGVFVVTAPDFVTAKKFSDADKKSAEDVVNFVDPCVAYPEKMAARATFQTHTGIAWALAALLLKLHAADAGARAGK